MQLRLIGKLKLTTLENMPMAIPEDWRRQLFLILMGGGWGSVCQKLEEWFREGGWKPNE